MRTFEHMRGKNMSTRINTYEDRIDDDSNWWWELLFAFLMIVVPTVIIVVYVYLKG